MIGLLLMLKLGINVDFGIVEMSHPQAGVKFRHVRAGGIQVTDSVRHTVEKRYPGG